MATRKSSSKVTRLVLEPAPPDNLVWYKSPVYIAIIVNILNGVVHILDLAHLVPPEVVESLVGDVLGVVALAAAVVAEKSRRKSSLQPITLTDENK